MQIRIKNKKIGASSPVFIIAEIGTNHNGDFNLARSLIRAAAKTGVDAVKFQIVSPDESYARGSVSYKIFKKAYLSYAALKRLKHEAQKKGLIFFATAGDLTSLDLMIQLKVPAIKISSGCMTHTVLLRKAAKTGLPVIISTGMSYLREVEDAVRELEQNKAKGIAILHCVSQYPAKDENLNLTVISNLRTKFPYPIGYSDHSTSNLASFLAVGLGAKVIEKHFTLDNKMKGPEHCFSADPLMMKDLVFGIRSIEKMLGSGKKAPSKCEEESRSGFRRYVVFAKDLKSGSLLGANDLSIKRIPGKKGLQPKAYYSLIGRRLKKDVIRDTPVIPQLLKRER